MKLDIISLIFLFIILICVIVGIKKGFFKILIDFFKNIVAFIVAILFAKPVATILTTTSFGIGMQNYLNDAFIKQGGVFSITITESNKVEVLNHALSEINIPEFLNGLLSNYLSKLIDISEPVNVATALSTTLTYYILISLSFIVLFVLVLLLSLLLNKLFEKLASKPLIGHVNSILGGALNGVIGIFVVCAITYVFTLIIPFSQTFSTWFADTVMLNDAETMTFAKYLYENNFLLKIIAFIQNLFA